MRMSSDARRMKDDTAEWYRVALSKRVRKIAGRYSSTRGTPPWTPCGLLSRHRIVPEFCDHLFSNVQSFGSLQLTMISAGASEN